MRARGAHAVIDILNDPRFRRLFAAQVVALVGTGLLTVALGLLAYDLAGADAGAVLGTALAIKMAAYVIVAPVVSAATYRVSRRALLVGADVVRASISLLLPFVDHTWQIYLLIFVLQSASATFTPAFQSVIPGVLVAERDYTRGLSLSRLAYDLETLLSPVLAAVLLSMMTYHRLFLGTVAGFLVSAYLVMKTDLPQVDGTRSAQSLWGRATAGARVMARRPVLRSLLALNLAVAAATSLVVVNTVVYVHGVLDGGSPAVAALLACYGGGSMAVALLVPRLLSTMADRRIMLAGAGIVSAGLLGVTVLLLAGPDPAIGWLAFPVAWATLGIGASLINTPSARLLRYEAEPSARSAVFAAQFSLSHACFFVTYPLAGWVGALAGQPLAAGVLAALAMAAGVTAARTWPSARASIHGIESEPAVA